MSNPSPFDSGIPDTSENPTIANNNSPKPFKPGDNPNKKNAKRRQVRPKAVNSLPDSKQNMSIPWADPIPQVPAISALDLQPNIVDDPIATITLENSLPLTISQPFADIYTNVGARLFRDEDRISDGADKLQALCYFKCAKQLYSAMTSVEKSNHQALKAVFYDDAEVPMHMSAAISMIGDFDSKVGNVKVADSGILFRRWIAAGLILDPDTVFTDANIEVDDAYSYIWRDSMSYDYMKNQIEKHINENRNPFAVDECDVQSPPFNKANPANWSARLHQDEPNLETWRLLATLFQMTRTAWRNAEYPEGFTAANERECLQNIGCALAPIELNTQTNILDMFEECMASYHASFKCDLNSIFKTGPNPASNKGFPAQIVSSHLNKATFNFPIADSDVGMGFMFNPCSKFNIQPNYVAYSKRNQATATAEFASRDTKPIAHD